MIYFEVVSDDINEFGRRLSGDQLAQNEARRRRHPKEISRYRIKQELIAIETVSGGGTITAACQGTNTLHLYGFADILSFNISKASDAR